MEVSSSASSSFELDTPPLCELIDRMHASLISLPEELCAASRPTSPTSEARTAAWKSEVAHAVQVAAGDTTHPKWGYVSRITKLACTSRGYIGIAPGIRIGDGRKVDVGKEFEWALPETEKDWTRCEKRWEAAADAEKKKAKAKPTSKATRTSKYWTEPVRDQPEASSSRPAPAPAPRKVDIVREKVERWQATVATEPEDLPASQTTIDLSQSSKADKTKGKAKAKETHPSSEKVQGSLGFPVVKRSSVTDAKGGRGAASKPKPTPPARPPTPPNHSLMPLGASRPPSPPEGQNSPADQQHQEVPHIAEMPELSFFPPSFPSQLKTSTPPLNIRRRKPAPIAPCSPPPSSPQSFASSKSFDPSRPQRREHPLASSSAAAVSPAQRPLKRARTPNSTADDRMDVTQTSPLARAPPPKKARTAPFLDQDPPISSGPQPVPPSTPPPTTSPSRAPVTPVSRAKGLGNAKGLPVPTTPDSHPLPTLTELLASSRRSKPRPRPPSRKHTPQSHTSSQAKRPAQAQHDAEAEPELPVVAEDDPEDDPEPSPTKTYFSSPASGSSDSGSVVNRSPISPLFSQLPGGFKPRFVSSQRPSANEDDPFVGAQSQSQSQGQGLARGSSGFFGMGYNSQFDVEGQVDRVSELLERDVDYSGWLRDLDDEEEPEAQTQSQSQSQAQSQGAVGVGY